MYLKRLLRLLLWTVLVDILVAQLSQPTSFDASSSPPPAAPTVNQITGNADVSTNIVGGRPVRMRAQLQALRV
jgi:hypothetical protein